MKEMKLYDHAERIYDELRADGLGDGEPLEVNDLTAHDQYHYHGLEALDAAIEDLALTSDSRVLDVGSGIGGPARYVADRAGCLVTALELQSDLHRLGKDLTRRCGLSDRVLHRAGDVLDPDIDGDLFGGAFDVLLSLLVFLHIPERRRLFGVCRQLLKPGGSIWIEDFIKLQEPSDQQWRHLRREVQCSYLPSPGEYRAHLEAAHFTDIVVQDMSAAWAAFTSERSRSFDAARERNVDVHGSEIVDGLGEYYRVVADLFASGAVGGVRISATAGA